MRGDDRAAVIERSGQVSRVVKLLGHDRARVFVASVKHEHDTEVPRQRVERIELGPRGIDPLDGGVNLDQPRASGAAAIELMQGIGAQRVDRAAGNDLRRVSGKVKYVVIR